MLIIYANKSRGHVGGSRLPERIGRLEELANNLWWSWHPQARDLFRALDYPLWRLGGHNPVKQLREISTDKLEEAASAPVFLSLYDSVMSAFDAGISAKDSWFATKYPNVLDGPVAYFLSSRGYSSNIGTASSTVIKGSTVNFHPSILKYATKRLFTSLIPSSTCPFSIS